MSKTKTYLKRAGIGLLAVIVLLGGSGGFYFKSYLPNTVAPQSFPQIEGEIQLEGLNTPVDIYRDEMGIPHIYADTLHDLFFAQGYVHAQDRFWQMDFWRHVGSGTISEMMGSSALETDKFLRTFGWKQTAEAEYTTLSPTTKAMVDSYAEGVNAYLADHDKTALSLEYAILGLLSPDYEIEPWNPINSLTWGKYMAWDLRANMDDELIRAYMLKNLPPEQVAEFYSGYPEDHPVIVNTIGGDAIVSTDISASPFVDIPDEALDQVYQSVSSLESVFGPTFDGIGSNSWALSGELTSTGTPLLANDPHLGIMIPSIWHQVHLECRIVNDACPFNVAGFSFAGAPGIIIGHNEKISWGFTNLAADVMDLYIEKINPENTDQYEVNGEWVDFEIREEVIQVAGGEPFTLTVKTTRHGPIISDVFGALKDNVDPEDPDAKPFKDKAGIELPEQYAVAVAWTALTPSTPFEAIWGFNLAQNWDEFREAARGWHVPSQNALYADVEGNIAYQTPGRIPTRSKGDGTLPVPGWTDEYEWTGYIPFDELPYVINPPEGYIVTANNKASPWDYPYNITQDWDYGFRAARILEMVTSAPGPIDIAYIQKMQGDSFNPNAANLVPALLNTELDSDLAAIRDDILAGWDYQNQSDSAAAALFEVFWKNLEINTFTDEMPANFWEKPIARSFWRQSIFYQLSRTISTQEDNHWWDDKNTPEQETRSDMFKKSFEQAANELTKLQGKDPANWNWGELHGAIFRNNPLGETGIGPIDSLFNRGPFPTGGGSSIVNATGWNPNEGYEVAWLPSMRMIVDLSDLNRSLTVHTTGQSGHAYHPHYDDMAPLWANVEYYPMYWNEQDIINNAEGHLILSPK